MKSEEFPALYRSASAISKQSQKWFFGALAVSLLFLVFATAFSTLDFQSPKFALFQAFALILSLAMTAYLQFFEPQRKWYAARALAESIKTMTWRYVMKAEPYNAKDSKSSEHFLKNLRHVLEDNTVLKAVVAVHVGDEITAKMRAVRSLTVGERIKYYSEHRIEDQLIWYRNKASFNQRRSRCWYLAVITLNIVAIVLAFSRVVYPAISFSIVDIVIATSSGAIAWLQTKRFQELAASYSFATHDINLLKAKAQLNATEKWFSDFVGDSENAFSREHTQWRARRDVE